MGDKIHYYCLNELLWHSALSAGNLWPQAVCPPGPSLIDPPEPDRGRRPILLLKQHSHPLWALLHKGLDPFLPTCSPAPEHALNSAHPASHLHRTAPNRGQSPGGHPAMIHAASVERPARSWVSVVEYHHRFTNPLLFILLRPSARKVGRM